MREWGAEFEARLTRATKAADLLMYVLWRHTEPAAQTFAAALRA